MTHAQRLAAFINQAEYECISEAARRQLKIRVLDALGCAIGALGSPVTQAIRKQICEFGGAPLCTMFGGGRSAPDRAAFYNSALVRYLDFNDSYLAKNETCHPSDNLGAALAACEYARGTGKDFLTALAVAYQVQCRLSDVAPVRDKGFDHATQGAYAVAAGVAKALKLNRDQTANALAICGTAFNALRVTRTGALSNWKGLAYPNTAFCATHGAFLAMHGITGPLEVFEGNKGFMDAISGRFEIDWCQEDLERVTRTIVKRYNAEIHSQSALEGVLELRNRYGFQPPAIERIDIEIFDVAFKIIGGGEEGDKSIVRTKEEADHSLPYLIAAALLDGDVMPEQYSPQRIQRADVQKLLRNVHIKPAQDLSDRFPREMPCRIWVRLQDRAGFFIEKSDYEGFMTRPASWEQAIDKFERLSAPHTSPSLRRQIIGVMDTLEMKPVRELTDLLEPVATSTLTEDLQYGGT
ncbi:MAG: MmgE/PrpD family protein [Bryobacterales bacterium]|nr:MmgE/PrpD family protein [Bryobacterales bacterium]MBV9399079.1 MmgE/PrpD family protein [Bryobacterales bacterium]